MGIYQGSTPLTGGGDFDIYKPKACLVRLQSSGWDSDTSTQSVTVGPVVANEAVQLVLPMPASKSRAAYNDAGIQLTAQSKGSVTFMCDTIPKENVDVWVVTEGVKDVTPPPPPVSTSPISGVNYVSGLQGLEASDVMSIARLISDCSYVTNKTSTIYIDNGSIHRKISVGDQVTLPLNGTDYAFDVIGFNHDTLTTPTAYGATTATGKAGITFQMHDLFGTSFKVNTDRTNAGGWKNSEMRRYTMVTMKGYLPSAWQAAIKPVNKESGTGGGSSSGTETVSDGCFLLCEVEVLGSIKYSVEGEGTQYAYYKAGNSIIKSQNGSAKNWLWRSAASGNNECFCNATAGGSEYFFIADHDVCISLCFCV